MINVTQNAEKYLSELIEKKDFDCDIRIFVSEPGTPRAETCLAFVKKMSPSQQMQRLSLKIYSFY